MTKYGGDNMSPSETPWQLKFLRQGTVYYFQHRDLKSAESHYFVVINPNPLNNHLLVLGVFSSQIESTKLRRRNLPPDTLVEISPQEYTELDLDSIIDCNSPIYIQMEQLVEKINRKEVRYHSDLSKELS
ncbi:MAG: hypothetical protein KAS17_03275, partial [Victivallaceae bacterium]|nr:hypothetical protein [Victivallaceae bacterium]